MAWWLAGGVSVIGKIFEEKSTFFGFSTCNPVKWHYIKFRYQPTNGELL